MHNSHFQPLGFPSNHSVHFTQLYTTSTENKSALATQNQSPREGVLNRVKRKPGKSDVCNSLLLYLFVVFFCWQWETTGLQGLGWSVLAGLSCRTASCQCGWAEADSGGGTGGTLRGTGPGGRCCWPAPASRDFCWQIYNQIFIAKLSGVILV